MKRHWEFVLIASFIIVYVFVRSFNLTHNLNFSQEQAQSGIESMRLIKEKKLLLIGPPFSFNLKGRYIFQGPLISYLPIIFFVPAGFDPVLATRLFILFGASMIVPLYFGIKWLIDRNAAYFMLILFASLPFFSDYTKFLWSPNYQFVLSTLLIFLLGFYKKKKNNVIFFTIFLLSGLLFQLHYQFMLIIIGLFLYFFLIKKENSWKILLFLGGISLGFLPIILFELRHNFYNLRTAVLFLGHFREIFLTRDGGPINPHYLLSSLLFTFLILAFVLRKRIRAAHLLALFIALFAWSVFKYSHILADPFHVGITWNYSDEVKTHNIIKAQNIKSFNIAHLNYDNKAVVQKFFLMRENVMGNFEDYYHNKYLFAVSNDENFSKYKAYEIATFSPRKILNKWRINKKYNLYLLQRKGLLD